MMRYGDTVSSQQDRETFNIFKKNIVDINKLEITHNVNIR